MKRRSPLALGTCYISWWLEFLGQPVTAQKLLKLLKPKVTTCLLSISPHLLIICHYLSSAVLLSLCWLMTGNVSWPTPSVWSSHTRHTQTDGLHTQHTQNATNKKHKHKSPKSKTQAHTHTTLLQLACKMYTSNFGKHEIHTDNTITS